jgi:hypothetical protein
LSPVIGQSRGARSETVAADHLPEKIVVATLLGEGFGYCACGSPAEHSDTCPIGGSSSARTTRCSVSGLAAKPRRLASRAPARPAKACPIASNKHAAHQCGPPRIRRRHPSTCSANVLAGQSAFVAEEPAHPQPDHHPPGSNRGIGEPPLVTTMHAAKTTAASRTHALRGADASVKQHHPALLLHSTDHQAGQVRQKTSNWIKITFR